MELIDKAKVVAEIKKRIDSNNERAAFYSSNSEHDYLCRVKEGVYESLLSFINTLKTKEVDLKEDVDRILYENDWDYDEIDFYEFAKHFYELGLKAQKGE